MIAREALIDALAGEQAARRLKLAEYVQTRDRLPLDTVRARFGVSRATIKRDLAALRRLGVRWGEGLAA